MLALLKLALLAASAAMTTGDAFAAPARRVALVIGNAAYAHITPLQKTIRDAEKVAEILQGLGYEVLLAKDARKTELDDLAQRFAARLKDADVGFFYFSGHGFQTNRMDQAHPVNHVVAVDFDLAGAEAELKTLPLDSIIQALKNEVRVGFVFMDTCRNDPRLASASQQFGSGSKTVVISRGLSPVNVLVDPPRVARPRMDKGPSGLLIAYATDPGNVAQEGNAGTMSPFTTALVKHIATPGLTAAEIMGRVSEDVSNQTAGQQTPWNVLSRTVGAYRFVAKPEAPSRPAAPRQAPAQPRPKAAPFQVQ
jgi:uncharacterized caspase-like protein